MSYGTEFLTPEREGELLAAIVVALPADDSGFSAFDGILCEFIELGLTDQDKGPEVLQQWRSLAAEGLVDDVDALRRVVLAVYEGEDDLYGHCDTCGLPCDKDGCVLDRGHVAALTIDEAEALRAAGGMR